MGYDVPPTYIKAAKSDASPWGQMRIPPDPAGGCLDDEEDGGGRMGKLAEQHTAADVGAGGGEEQQAQSDIGNNGAGLAVGKGKQFQTTHAVCNGWKMLQNSCSGVMGVEMQLRLQGFGEGFGVCGLWFRFCGLGFRV